MKQKTVFQIDRSSKQKFSRKNTYKRDVLKASLIKALNDE